MACPKTGLLVSLLRGDQPGRRGRVDDRFPPAHEIRQQTARRRRQDQPVAVVPGIQPEPVEARHRTDIGDTFGRARAQPCPVGHRLHVRQFRQQFCRRRPEAFQRLVGRRLVEARMFQGAADQDVAVAPRNRVAPWPAPCAAGNPPRTCRGSSALSPVPRAVPGQAASTTRRSRRLPPAAPCRHGSRHARSPRRPLDRRRATSRAPPSAHATRDWRIVAGMPAMSAPGEDCAHWPRPTCRPPAGSPRPARAPPRRPPRSALPSTAGCACVPTAVPRSGRQVQPVQANGMDLGIEPGLVEQTLPQGRVEVLRPVRQGGHRRAVAPRIERRDDPAPAQDASRPLSPRSTRVTRSPASASSRAVNRPMTPAPTTTTLSDTRASTITQGLQKSRSYASSRS